MFGFMVFFVVCRRHNRSSRQPLANNDGNGNASNGAVVADASVGASAGGAADSRATSIPAAAVAVTVDSRSRDGRHYGALINHD
jgi:hypothetical protein